MDDIIRGAPMHKVAKVLDRESLEAKRAAEKIMGYVHPYAVTAIVAIAFAAGTTFTWWAFNSPENRGYGLLISICLIWAFKWPIKMWRTWAAGHDEEWIQEQVEKELGSLDSGPTQAINDDDFDAATKSILIKTIKAARKQKAKVSVPFLLKKLSESIH